MTSEEQIDKFLLSYAEERFVDAEQRALWYEIAKSAPAVQLREALQELLRAHPERMPGPNALRQLLRGKRWWARQALEADTPATPVTAETRAFCRNLARVFCSVGKRDGGDEEEAVKCGQCGRSHWHSPAVAALFRQQRLPCESCRWQN